MVDGIEIWQSQVRDYEVDFQGIVNNAFYHNYLDNARVEFLYHRNIDLLSYAQKDIHIVVTSCTVMFKSPLKWRDKIYVETALYKTERKVVVQFKQRIITERDGIKIVCAIADNYVCASVKGKPVFLAELYNIAAG